jgi:hypothetical protein
MSDADPMVVATAASHGVRLSWSAVWSGFLVVVGLILLLSVLGLAVGVTAASVAAVDMSLEVAENGLKVGIGALVWCVGSLLIALFIGGLAASRSGVVVDAAAGAINGFLIWVLTVLAFVAMAASGLGATALAMFSTLASMGSAANAPPALPDAQAILWSTLAAMVATLLAAVAGAGVGRRQLKKRATAIRIHDAVASDSPLTITRAARPAPGSAH